MPIRVPRTVQPALPDQRTAVGQIAPASPLNNPAAQVAPAAQQAAGLAAQLYQQERDQEIATRLQELDIERREADGRLVDEYLQAQGKDAVDKRAKIHAAIDGNSQRIRSGIQDQEVARLWANQDRALTNAASNQIDGHYRQQKLRWQDDTLQKRTGLLVTDLGRVAFGEGYDPATGRLSDEAERTRSAFLDAINERGRLLGWSPEQVETERRRAESEAYGQVAQSLIAQERYDEADAVLEKHGGQIDVGLRDALQSTAKTARKHSERNATAQRLVSEYEGKGRNIAETIDMVDGAGLDVDVRDELVRRLQVREKTRIDAEAREGNQLFKTVQQKVLLGEAPDAAELTRLEELGLSRDLRYWMESGQFRETNDAGARLMRSHMANPEKLQSFGTLDDLELTFGRMLSRSDMDTLTAAWRTARQQPTPEDAIKIDEDAIIWQAFLRSGVSVDSDVLLSNVKSSEDVGRQWEAFSLAVRNQVNASVVGRKATSKDIRDAAKFVTEDAVKMSDGTQRPLSVMDNTDWQQGVFSTPYGKIDGNKLFSSDPATADRQRAEAIQQLEKQGKPVTVAAIANIRHAEIAKANRDNEQRIEAEKERGRRFILTRFRNAMTAANMQLRVAEQQQLEARERFGTEVRPIDAGTPERRSQATRDYVLRLYGPELGAYGIDVEEARAYINEQVGIPESEQERRYREDRENDPVRRVYRDPESILRARFGK